MRFRRRGSLALAVLVSGLASACEKPGAPGECVELADTVNQRLDQLRQQRGEVSRDSEAKESAASASLHLDLAKGYARLAADVEALPAKNERLAPLVQRYADLARQASAALRSSGQAIAQHDVEQAKRSQASFDTLSSDQARLLGSIHGVCNPPEL